VTGVGLGGRAFKYPMAVFKFTTWASRRLLYVGRG